MLHTKFRGNRPSGSGEADFFRGFIVYGRCGHLGHVTRMPQTNFLSPCQRRLLVKFGFNLEKMFEHCVLRWHGRSMIIQ